MFIVYSKYDQRRDLLQFIFVSFQKDIATKRHGFINKIKQPNSDEISRIVIKTYQNKTKLTLEKKEFNLHDDHDSFFSNNVQQVIDKTFSLIFIITIIYPEGVHVS